MPDLIGMLPDPRLHIAASVEVFAGEQEPLYEVRGFQEVGAVVFRHERYGLAAARVDEVGVGAVVAFGLVQQEVGDPEDPSCGIIAAHEAPFDAQDDIEDPYADR